MMLLSISKGDIMSNYNKNFGGLRINFKGKVSTQQIIETLACDLTALQENFGIEEFSGVNFYCQLYKNSEPQAIVINSSNQLIDGYTNEPDPSYKTVTEEEDGSKNYKYDKGLDIPKLEKNFEGKINKNLINKDRFSIMSKSEIEKEIQKKENELRILEIAREKKRLEERAKKLAKEREKEEELNKFKEQLKIDFDIEEKNFKIKVASIGSLELPSAIKKYLGKDAVIDDKYFRVTMKNEKTGKAGDIYIYNVNYKLVKIIPKQLRLLT